MAYWWKLELTFIDLDGDSWLVVRGGGEDLRLLGWYHGVPGDQLGHHSSNSLNTKSQGANIQKNQVTYSNQNTFEFMDQ